MRRILPVLAAALVVLTAACAAPASDTSEVPGLSLDLSDFKIITDHPTVAAGRVVIAIRNHASRAFAAPPSIGSLSASTSVLMTLTSWPIEA